MRRRWQAAELGASGRVDGGGCGEGRVVLVLLVVVELGLVLRGACGLHRGGPLSVRGLKGLTLRAKPAHLAAWRRAGGQGGAAGRGGAGGRQVRCGEACWQRHVTRPGRGVVATLAAVSSLREAHFASSLRRRKEHWGATGVKCTGVLGGVGGGWGGRWVGWEVGGVGGGGAVLRAKAAAGWRERAGACEREQGARSGRCWEGGVAPAWPSLRPSGRSCPHRPPCRGAGPQPERR